MRVCERCGSELGSRQRRWCSNACRKRGWELAAYRDRPDLRGVCEQCGGPLGAWRRQQRVGVCERCLSAAREARDGRIEAMWRDGQTLTQIADELGWTVNHLGVEMVRMRKAGCDLPLRRPGRKAAA